MPLNAKKKRLLILMLIILQLQIQQLLELWLAILQLYEAMQKVEAAEKKIPRRFRTLPVRQTPRKRKRAPTTEPIDILQVDIYERTGLYDDEFETVYQKLADSLVESDERKQSSLTLHVRLLLVLDWLRNYGDYKTIAVMYKISKATVCREVRFILPHLLPALKCIEWPAVGQFPISPFEGVNGAIDCTAHYRRRVHPGQADYYRGDKRRHFMAAQVTTGLNGKIFNVALGKGHNNDQGMLELTGMKDFLYQNQVKLLADGGYRYMNLVTPDETRGVAWNNTQMGLRPVVETVIGYVKGWDAAAATFRHAPEIQQLALACIYEIAAARFKITPLRPQAM